MRRRWNWWIFLAVPVLCGADKRCIRSDCATPLALRARHLQAGTTPSAEEVVAARQLVGWQGIEVEPSRLALARRGMAVTLNGIAQGYITDRVAEMLRGAGMGNVLVSLGETRALGPHPEGRPWEDCACRGC